jgi:Pyruvate/2-oxoacid:ferredoxin oxidoreductase delta subunit
MENPRLSKLKGLEAWLPTTECTNAFWGMDCISYCPEHDIITEGHLKEHYCDGTISLGYVSGTYIDHLEREIWELKKELNEQT